MKLAVWFAVRGDGRFFSHRDTMTVWQRALIRAGVPILYSSGFNPHPRITLPLPRSVGVHSEHELLLVYLAEDYSSDRATAHLPGQLPVGLVLLSASLIPRSLSCQPASAEYRLTLSDEADRDALRRRIEAFQASRQWEVSRPNPARHARKSIDLKESIRHLRLEGDHLEFTLRIDPSGTPRMEEIRDAFALPPGQIRQILRVRTEYPDWNEEPGADAAPSAGEV